MEAAKPVTARDVARLLEGMIDDPGEASRIIAATAQNPLLAKLADVLGDDEDDAEVPELDPNLLPDLSRTRLCRLRPTPELLGVAEGRGCTTLIEYERDGNLETFELRMTPQAEGGVRLDADWPVGLRPVGLVLEQFDLEQGATPLETTVTIPAPPRGSGGAAPAGAPHRSFAAAAATGDARTGEDRQARTGAPASPFAARQDPRQLNRLTIECRLPGERDVRIVIAELRIGAMLVRHPVQLDRRPHQPRGYREVTDFPWPADAGDRQALLTVRPLRHADLPLLTSEQVSTLLGTEEEFVAVPIRKDEAGHLSATFKYTDQQSFATSDRTAWFVRMCEAGGAA